MLNLLCGHAQHGASFNDRALPDQPYDSLAQPEVLSSSQPPLISKNLDSAGVECEEKASRLLVTLKMGRFWIYTPLKQSQHFCQLRMELEVDLR